MPTTTKLKREHAAERTPQARPKPHAAPSVRPRRKARPRRLPLLPIGVIVAVFTTHMTAVAMLNYESARCESLRREKDRIKLNIERLQGQLAVHTKEVSVRRWAEQAGMVRVDEQPELTIIGLDAPTSPPAPVAMDIPALLR
jgi:hypothetical protein